MFINLFIYGLFILILLGALGLIISKNPVQSVLLLVLVFLQTSLLFFILGAEFLAILLITVYVGAIAILFLFVVMLLNLRIVELYNSLQYHIPIGSFVGVLFVAILWEIFSYDFGKITLASFSSADFFFSWGQLVFFDSNLQAVGEVFYNYYLDIFFIITFLLLIAMIGVILLAVDFDYREEKNEKDLFFANNLRRSKKNLVWLNMEIYAKQRLALKSSRIKLI